jgi:hypothetical protein
MKEILFFLGVTAIGFFAATALAVLMWFTTGYPLSLYQCSNYGEVTGRETKYILFNGCYVKTSKGLIPRSEFSIRAATHQLGGE